MRTASRIADQINQRIRRLVEVGLADRFQSGFPRQAGKRTEVTFPNAAHVSMALKNREYPEIYRLFVRERVYNVKMLDGALIQMMYEFSGDRLQRHRLAFFPAPHLREFQNSPDVYLDDELHGDVVAGSVVPFPLRCDYDGRDGRHVDVTHPKSHLTLGQYEHCRIPVSAPVTPHWFIDFLLRNFYQASGRGYAGYTDEVPVGGVSFEESISPAERRVVHLVIPGPAAASARHDGHQSPGAVAGEYRRGHHALPVAAGRSAEARTRDGLTREETRKGRAADFMQLWGTWPGDEPLEDLLAQLD